MKRISSATRAIDLFGAGKDGFKDGDKGAGVSPTDLDAGWFNRVQEELANAIEGAGLTLDAAGTNNTQLLQAIRLIMSGGDFHSSCRVASTVNLSTAAPGASIDGVTMAVNDRVLLKDQTTGSQNGIWQWNGAAAAMTRTLDADTGAEMNGGAIVAVEEGTTNADSLWMCTNDGAVTIGATALTFSRKDGAVNNTSQAKNRIINGNMIVDQRNVGAAKTYTAAAALSYAVDRWYGYCTGSNITGQRSAFAGYYFGYQFTGAAANTGLGYGQRIESNQIGDLASSTVTLSAILASSSLANVTWSAYYANTADTFGTLASPTRTLISTGTFNISNVLTKYSTQIALPANAANGVEIVFSGGALLAAQTLSITNVQLEAGSIPTTYDIKTLLQELVSCQRYFNKTFNYTVPPANNAGFAGAIGGIVHAATISPQGQWSFNHMRGTPAVTAYNPGGGAAGNWRQSTNAADIGAATFPNVGDSGVFVTSASTSTAGNVFYVHMTADAEL